MASTTWPTRATTRPGSSTNGRGARLHPRLQPGRLGRRQGDPGGVARAGRPGPLAVKWTSGGGHALLAYDRRVQTQPDGTETVDYRVYDPDDGQSTWIPQGDLIGANSKDGTFDYRGNTALNAYVMVAMEPGQGGRDANPALQRYQERNVVRDSVVTQEIR